MKCDRGIQRKLFALTDVAQLSDHHAMYSEVDSSTPSQGTCPVADVISSRDL